MAALIPADGRHVEEASFQNHLLAGLPDTELHVIRAALHPTQLVRDQTLYEVGDRVDRVYFPESGLVSLLGETGDGGSVEIGLTGHEGLIGVSALLGPHPVAVHRTMVQLPGDAHWLQAAFFRDQIDRLPVLRDRSFRFLQCAMIRSAQAAACNARHQLTQRLAKLLLMAHDRAGSDQLLLTQKTMSRRLGMRRAGVSAAARDLEVAGLIRQGRGGVAITDRAGLEAKACSCYRFVERSCAAITGPS